MSYDTDAQAYFTAVESADTQALETGVKNAINAFVVGCKTDGIWSAIKAACIMAGARTLDGALTPLVGSAPTNVSGNFVSGDYDRKTGLIGNGSTKYLNSNRNNNADPQNNNHNAVWVSALGTDVRCYIGCLGGTESGTNQIIYNTTFQTRSRGSAGTFTNSGSVSTGLWGMSRASSTSYSRRASNTNSTGSYSSSTPANANILIFARGTAGTPNLVSDGRLSFYSIGESLDLALLDARLTTLMAALGNDATYSTLRRNHAFIGVAF
jgi:hypothetical protein